MFGTQYLIVDLDSISFSTLSEVFPFSFYWVSFLCLPIVCETLLVSLCFFNWSLLTPWVCGVNFYGRRHVSFSGAVSLISWTCCSWGDIYVGSLDVTAFWLSLGHSLFGPSLQLVDWGSLCTSHLYAVVQVLPEENQKAQGTNPHPQKHLLPAISVSTANAQVVMRVYRG